MGDRPNAAGADRLAHEVKMTDPLLSVTVTNYNYGQYLAEADRV